MTPGLIALFVALACALAGGLAWRRGNGRIRAVGANDFLGRSESTDSPPRSAGLHVTSQDLGQELGRRATLVQFSSAFCAPCRATRRILTDVAAMVEGVAYVEVDAESRLDLVRRMSVLRTPTVLITDAGGRVVRRASGQPRKPDVIAALGQATAGTDIYGISGRE